jgi:hypothetical protein
MGGRSSRRRHNEHEHCWHISRAGRQPKAAPHGMHVPEASWPLKPDRVRRIQTCCWCGTSEPHDPDKAHAADWKRWQRDMARIQARLQRIPRPRTKAGASR